MTHPAGMKGGTSLGTNMAPCRESSMEFGSWLTRWHLGHLQTWLNVGTMHGVDKSIVGSGHE